MSTIGKIKLAFSAFLGGTTGVVKCLLSMFNDNVLSKIDNKEEARVYFLDVQATTVFIRALMNNHENNLSTERKEAIQSILDALDSLANALDDFTIEDEEFEVFVEHVKVAIQKFKR